MLKRLAIITTHPIQYNAPVFALLAQRKNIIIKVFYTWGKAVLEDKYDPGFGKSITWDIPLLKGYEYEFVENTATAPGSHHFSGINNPGLNESIENWKADAVLVFGWAFQGHLKAMRYFHGKIPVLFRGDSTLLDELPGIRKIMRHIMLSYVYRNVNTVLYTGSANKLYYRKFGIKPQQMVFAPHAVDNSRFGDIAASITRAEVMRMKLGIAAGSLVYLFAGKLEPKKNPRLLLSAFIAAALKNAHLVIAGNGILEASLKNDFAGYDNIHFLPFQNQSAMPGLYHAADVFILPSAGPGETWGLAINEAMASGLAVIASDKCGAAQDLIEEGVNGYVFESGSQQKLTAYLEKFNYKSSAKVMGEKGKEKIWDWSLTALAKAIENAFISS